MPSISRRTLGVVAVLAAAVTLAGAPARAQRATREQQVVVSVLDRAGEPISGLGSADFVVREDDVAREVLRVDQASAPMQIMLLADTSSDMQLDIQEVRAGLKAFSKAIWAKSPDSDMTLMEYGERPNQLGETTRTAEVLNRAVDRLFEHPGSGAYLLDAIVDATALLKKRDAKRPVLVVFTRESSPEFSTRQHQEIESVLKEARAGLWIMLLQDRRRADMSNEGQQRDIVLGDSSTRSGGMRDVALNRMGIEPHYVQIANRLTSQYAVTYSRRDDLIPPTRLEVTVKRDGARVLAPRWTGQ